MTTADPSTSGSDDAPLATTPLHALHVALGARMVPFAGYEMPVQYPAGVLAEHRHARTAAALFDVSHMGQLRLVGADADRALESLVPMDLVGLAPSQQRYAFFTDASSGILDDLMVTRVDGGLALVVNASRKVHDTAYLRAELGAPGGPEVDVVSLDDHALLALQGPAAVDVLSRLCPDVDARWTFMTARTLTIDGIRCDATRSGYTGEDGFEISVEGRDAERLARLLLLQPEVAPAGLAARDTLRLEAGLCLYGHDIDVDTTPAEAVLGWAVSKARRTGGARAGGFPGAATILAQLAAAGGEAAVQPLRRKRVGLVGADRTPVREGSVLVAADGVEVGRVTSGTFGPTANRAIAMGYVPPSLAAVGTALFALVRGKRVAMHVAAMPFVPHRYHRGPGA